MSPLALPLGWLTCIDIPLLKPSFDVCGVEPNELADLEIADAPLGHEPPDETRRDVELL